MSTNHELIRGRVPARPERLVIQHPDFPDGRTQWKVSTDGAVRLRDALIEETTGVTYPLTTDRGSGTSIPQQTACGHGDAMTVTTETDDVFIGVPGPKPSGDVLVWERVVDNPVLARWLHYSPARDMFAWADSDQPDYRSLTWWRWEMNNQHANPDIFRARTVKGPDYGE